MTPGVGAGDSAQRNHLGRTQPLEIIENVAAQRNVPLFDFASAMPTDRQHWADGRHVNEEGALLKAELFAAFIDKQELIPPALTRAPEN